MASLRKGRFINAFQSIQMIGDYEGNEACSPSEFESSSYEGHQINCGDKNEREDPLLNPFGIWSSKSYSEDSNLSNSGMLKVDNAVSGNSLTIKDMVFDSPHNESSLSGNGNELYNPLEIEEDGNSVGENTSSLSQSHSVTVKHEGKEMDTCAEIKASKYVKSLIKNEPLALKPVNAGNRVSGTDFLETKHMSSKTDEHSLSEDDELLGTALAELEADEEEAKAKKPLCFEGPMISGKEDVCDKRKDFHEHPKKKKKKKKSKTKPRDYELKVGDAKKKKKQKKKKKSYDKVDDLNEQKKKDRKKNKLSRDSALHEMSSSDEISRHERSVYAHGRERSKSSSEKESKLKPLVRKERSVLSKAGQSSSYHKLDKLYELADRDVLVNLSRKGSNSKGQSSALDCDLEKHVLDRKDRKYPKVHDKPSAIKVQDKCYNVEDQEQSTAAKKQEMEMKQSFTGMVDHQNRCTRVSPEYKYDSNFLLSKSQENLEKELQYQSFSKSQTNPNECRDKVGIESLNGTVISMQKQMPVYEEGRINVKKSIHSNSFSDSNSESCTSKNVPVKKLSVQDVTAIARKPHNYQDKIAEPNLRARLHSGSDSSEFPDGNDMQLAPIPKGAVSTEKPDAISHEPISRQGEYRSNVDRAPDKNLLLKSPSRAKDSLHKGSVSPESLPNLKLAYAQKRVVYGSGLSEETTSAQGIVPAKVQEPISPPSPDSTNPLVIHLEESPYNPEAASPLISTPRSCILGDQDNEVDFTATVYKEIGPFDDIMRSKVKNEARKHRKRDSNSITLEGPDLGKKRKYELVEYLVRQRRVEEEMKTVLKTYYKSREITKEEYKAILKKAVPQVTMSNSPIIPEKISSLMKKFIRKTKGQRLSNPKVASKRNNIQKNEEELKKLQLQTSSLYAKSFPKFPIRVLNPNLPMPPM